jgi:hypothetical protein
MKYLKKEKNKDSNFKIKSHLIVNKIQNNFLIKNKIFFKTINYTSNKITIFLVLLLKL